MPRAVESMSNVSLNVDSHEDKCIYIINVAQFCTGVLPDMPPFLYLAYPYVRSEK